MTESKRRSNIKKIQARQRRYHAMGRCWCGRVLKAGYKRCRNCMERIHQRRDKYQADGRCYYGNLISPRVKPNGDLYKICSRFRARSKAHYQKRRVD